MAAALVFALAAAPALARQGHGRFHGGHGGRTPHGSWGRHDGHGPRHGGWVGRRPYGHRHYARGWPGYVGFGLPYVVVPRVYPYPPYYHPYPYPYPPYPRVDCDPRFPYWDPRACW